jgi:hypothetical protein
MHDTSSVVTSRASQYHGQESERQVKGLDKFTGHLNLLSQGNLVLLACRETGPSIPAVEPINHPCALSPPSPPSPSNKDRHCIIAVHAAKVHTFSAVCSFPEAVVHSQSAPLTGHLEGLVLNFRCIGSSTPSSLLRHLQDHLSVLHPSGTYNNTGISSLLHPLRVRLTSQLRQTLIATKFA